MRRCRSTGIFSQSSPDSLVLRSRTVADSAMVMVWLWLPSPPALTLKVIWGSLAPSAPSAISGCGGGQRSAGPEAKLEEDDLLLPENGRGEADRALHSSCEAGGGVGSQQRLDGLAEIWPVAASRIGA